MKIWVMSKKKYWWGKMCLDVPYVQVTFPWKFGVVNSPIQIDTLSRVYDYMGWLGLKK